MKDIDHLDLLYLFVFISVGCGESQKFQTRIVGGRPAKADEWPWLAALVSTFLLRLAATLLETPKV